MAYHPGPRPRGTHRPRPPARRPRLLPGPSGSQLLSSLPGAEFNLGNSCSRCVSPHKLGQLARQEGARRGQAGAVAGTFPEPSHVPGDVSPKQRAIQGLLQPPDGAAGNVPWGQGSTAPPPNQTASSGSEGPSPLGSGCRPPHSGWGIPDGPHLVLTTFHSKLCPCGCILTSELSYAA